MVECLDVHARITSKGPAPIHSVKSGTLQNGCPTRPRVVADLGKGARTHIVRLMNNLVKWSTKNDDKSAVAMLKKHELHDRTEQPVVNRDKSHDRTVQPVVEGHEIQRQNSEKEQSGTLLDRQREQILAVCQAEIRKHEFQADHDPRSKHILIETIESQQEELHRAQAEERRRQDQQLLHEQLVKQNWDLREAHENSLKEMEELKKFQSSTFDTIARRRLVQDQDTVLELTGKIQELQNEVSCMNDSRDFHDAESVRSGHSHVANQPVSFPPGGMLSRSFGMPSRRTGRQAFGTRMFRETFLQVQLCLLQHFIRRN